MMKRLTARPRVCWSALLCASLIVVTGCPDDDPTPPADTDGAVTSTGLDCGASAGECTTAGALGTSTSTGTPDPDDTSDNPDADDDSSTTGEPECGASAECDAAFCVAPFDPKLGVFGRGPFECVVECVVLEDELRWCADADACCNPEAECTDRGYCELLGVADSTDDDSTGGDATNGGSTGADSTGDDTTGSASE